MAYTLKSHLGGDCSIAWSEPPTDRGASPLDGIHRDDFGVAFPMRPQSADWRENQDNLMQMVITWEQIIQSGQLPKGCKSLQDAWNHWQETVDLLAEMQEKPSKKRAPRGQNGITSYARKNVRSGCTYLEQKYGKECLSFFTGTLGNLTPDELKVCRDKWSEITRQFCQMLTREARRRGMPEEWVYASEIQESRWRRRGEVAPHIHVVFPGRRRRRDAWVYPVKMLQGFWERAVSNAIGRQWSSAAATNVQRIKKSAANYMAKYLSKGSKCLAEVKENQPEVNLPSAWSGSSKKVKRVVKRAVKSVHLPPVALDTLLQFIEALPYVVYFKAMWIQTEDGLTRTVALYGRVPPDKVNRFRRDVREHLESRPPMPAFSEIFGRPLPRVKVAR